jgi:CheY-like chemotaxis protein
MVVNDYPGDAPPRGRRTSPPVQASYEAGAAELTVLIVDDHLSFRSIAARLLTASGFCVVGVVGDGAGALTVARELCPDLVLLDIQLPGTDGFTVASALAAQPDPPSIVLMSSRARADYGPSVDAAPVRGFIAKADLSGPAIHALLTGS